MEECLNIEPGDLDEWLRNLAGFGPQAVDEGFLDNEAGTRSSTVTVEEPTDRKPSTGKEA